MMRKFLITCFALCFAGAALAADVGGVKLADKAAVGGQELVLNGAGIWHFDQIAAWKARDIAEIDARLGAFKGRITRDAWVPQARALVAMGAPPQQKPPPTRKARP